MKGINRQRSRDEKGREIERQRDRAAETHTHTHTTTYRRVDFGQTSPNVCALRHGRRGSVGHTV
jgi:hypothetical protein